MGGGIFVRASARLAVARLRRAGVAPRGGDGHAHGSDHPGNAFRNPAAPRDGAWADKVAQASPPAWLVAAASSRRNPNRRQDAAATSEQAGRLRYADSPILATPSPDPSIRR